MSDTPRFDDAFEHFVRSGHTNHDILRDLCKQLEQELNEANKIIHDKHPLRRCRELRQELQSVQVQRDQVLHLLSGGTLSEQAVISSGLGVGVLSEQRHHEYMRCKAESEVDALKDRVSELESKMEQVMPTLT